MLRIVYAKRVWPEKWKPFLQIADTEDNWDRFISGSESVWIIPIPNMWVIFAR